MLLWWQAEIGSVPISQCTPELVGEMRERLAAGHPTGRRPRSAATVNRYLARLSHVFTVAIKEWQWAHENPVRKATRLEEPRGRVRCLSDDERKRLLAACRASSCPCLFPLVVLALSTGGRRNELLSLRWADVDLARERILLQETKNGDRRALPLKGRALQEITCLAAVASSPTAWVFPGRDGTRPRDVQTAWKNALKAAGIEDFRFHDLRHCAASSLAMSAAAQLGYRLLAAQPFEDYPGLLFG